MVHNLSIKIMASAVVLAVLLSACVGAQVSSAPAPAAVTDMTVVPSLTATVAAFPTTLSTPTSLRAPVLAPTVPPETAGATLPLEQVPAATGIPPASANPQAKYTVGAYWYPWYDSNGQHWKQGYRGTPALGQYASGDPKIIEQQIKWATGAGIDFFVASWWGKDSFEDKIMRGRFLDVAGAGNIHFAVLYESAALLNKTGSTINLDDPAVRQKMVQDFKYLAATYMIKPSYLRIAGRPVVFLYLSRIFAGNVAEALNGARNAVKETIGQDVFIVGDEVYWQAPTAARLALFDGVTGYNMHTARPDIADGFVSKVVQQYQVWEQAAEGAGVTFIPGIIPGFDDTAVRPQDHHPVIPRSPELFADLLKGSMPLATGQAQMLVVTSWNEWHEYTSIEPSKEFGTTYLDVLRDTLAGK
jgi:hypothetical protein